MKGMGVTLKHSHLEDGASIIIRKQFDPIVQFMTPTTAIKVRTALDGAYADAAAVVTNE